MNFITEAGRTPTDVSKSEWGGTQYRQFPFRNQLLGSALPWPSPAGLAAPLATPKQAASPSVLRRTAHGDEREVIVILRDGSTIEGEIRDVEVEQR